MKTDHQLLMRDKPSGMSEEYAAWAALFEPKPEGFTLQSLSVPLWMVPNKRFQDKALEKFGQFDGFGPDLQVRVGHNDEYDNFWCRISITVDDFIGDGDKRQRDVHEFETQPVALAVKILDKLAEGYDVEIRLSKSDDVVGTVTWEQAA